MTASAKKSGSETDAAETSDEVGVGGIALATAIGKAAKLNESTAFCRRNEAARNSSVPGLWGIATTAKWTPATKMTKISGQNTAVLKTPFTRGTKLDRILLMALLYIMPACFQS